MKYLKITLFVFVASIAFATYNAHAGQIINLINVKIPILKGNYISQQFNKDDVQNIQNIVKTKCVDNTTGDGRVILARVQGMFTGMGTSNWIEAKPNQESSFGEVSRTLGGWKLWLQSNKFMWTDASFSGIWNFEF